MNVLVVGAGLMGAQIGCEYLTGGHEVTFLARDTGGVRRRVEAGLELAARIGRAPRPETELRIVDGDAPREGWDLVVESLPEELALKAELLAPLVTGSPDAIVASNTSSLSITALGEAIGAPARTVGAHYWNPPLLMPLVEVVAGAATDPAVVDRMCALLESLGKRVVRVERDVPGFVWNRLQLAVMREALWLVEQGVVTPEAVDATVRDGLARRWRHVGPFAAAALGGIATWSAVGENLLPELSRAQDLEGLERWLPTDPGLLDGIRERRDEALAAELRGETGPTT